MKKAEKISVVTSEITMAELKKVLKKHNAQTDGLPLLLMIMYINQCGKVEIKGEGLDCTLEEIQ